LNCSSRTHWIRLWKKAGAIGNRSIWYDRLCEVYASPGRHYHTLRHVNDCLEDFERVRLFAINGAAVELAIWFHDAVYDSRATDNEERSAALARQCLEEARVARGITDSTCKLILATRTHDTSLDKDAGVMVDVDLAILGKPEDRFHEYEFQIRQEYSWVPDKTFAAGRAEILSRFFSRPRIYSTDWFFDHFEGPARRNIARSLEKLRYV